MRDIREGERKKERRRMRKGKEEGEREKGRREISIHVVSYLGYVMVWGLIKVTLYELHWVGLGLAIGVVDGVQVGLHIITD